MLNTLEGSTSMELAERLHTHTKYVGFAGIGSVVAAGAALGGCTGFLPPFFHPFYIGPEAKPWDRASGWLTLEASFDNLSPKVGQLGLRRFVQRLQLSNSALESFHTAWNLGVSHYQSIQRQVAAPQALGFLTVCIGLSSPLGLLLMGFPYDESVLWFHVMFHVALWSTCGLLGGFLVVLPYMTTSSMLKLRSDSHQLVIENPLHRLFITQVVDVTQLTCEFAHLLPVGRSAVVIVTTILVA
eukprot:6319867-Prymnesium_polylepis.1